MVKSITEAFENLKPAFEQVGKAITEAFRKTKWTGLQLRKELISNNRRKMKGMPMIRAKAIEKARRNERRKLRPLDLYIPQLQSYAYVPVGISRPGMRVRGLCMA